MIARRRRSGRELPAAGPALGAARLAALAMLLAAAAGCGTRAREHVGASRLSEAQRDSAIARSQIPGAAAVGHAFGAAGKAAGHSAALDSLANPR